MTPGKRGRGRKRCQPAGDNWLDKTPAERHAAMTGFCSCKTGIYAIPGKNMDAPKVGPLRGRLKRVFNIDIETCERCAGQVKIIACIEDPSVIERILAHLNGKEPLIGKAMLPEDRAPPQAGLFD